MARLRRLAMGDSKRQGRWRVERPLAALAIMGDVVLDLRGAEVPQGEVDITATAIMGTSRSMFPTAWTYS